uniref:Glucose-6-phosphate translocase n=1 Tax=Aceria tosichella TaxID=561515 RepID=A0A6G1S6D7_9ACAR
MTTKYLIFSVIFFGYAMFGYNRKGVSFVIPKLLEEGLQNEQVGLILSSQNLAYAISKFLGGIISDRLSSRLLFSAGLLASGLAAVLFSLVDSVPLFTLAWFINGLAQGVGWPAIAKLLKNWFDPAELGTWWSAASASANVSGCVAPFLASYLILNYGWRFSLTFVGGLTILAAAIAYLFIQDSPAITPAATGGAVGSPSKKRATTDKPKTASPPKKSTTQGKSALRLLLQTKFIWVISICYLIVSSIKTCVTDWSQMYLMHDCRQPSLVANSFVSSVEFGGFFGGIAAGYLSDLYMKRTLNGGKELPSSGHPRMTVGLAFAVVTASCLHLLYFNVSETTSVIFINQLGILIGASVYGQIAIFGVVATQSVVSEMSGTSHAIAALAANVGSIIAGLPFATLARLYSWSHVFFILEVMTIATIAFMLVFSRISYRMDLGDGDQKKEKSE